MAAPAAPAKGRPPKAPPRNATLAAYAAVCLALCAGVVVFMAPRGFVFLGERLEPLLGVGLAAAAVLAGAYGAFAAQERRVLPGALAAAALLSPAVDARAPLERLPAYLAAAVLFILYLEFALLHAKVARLSRLPRAHVTTAGQAREVELQATAGRIAGSWPTPLGMALGLVLACLALQLGLAAAAPPALGRSLEMNGPFGLGLAAALLLGGLAGYVFLVRLPRERRVAPQREDEPAAQG